MKLSTRKLCIIVLGLAIVALTTLVWAGALITNPKFEERDGNGVPYSGGKVNFYQPGSTTRKNTYTTRDMSVANANPVVLDTDGRATIYGAGLYKIVFTDASDVEIWTLDNVEIVGAGGGYNLYPDAAESDHGKAGNGSSFYDYLTALGTSKKATVIFGHSGLANTTIYTVATSFNASAYSNVILRFENGALLSPSSGITLTTIADNIIAGKTQQIFSGSGTISFGANSVFWANWFGLSESGTAAANATAMANANAAGANPCTVLVAAGSYSCDPFTFSLNYSALKGDGLGRPKLTYTGATTFITVSGAGARIENLHIYGTSPPTAGTIGLLSSNNSQKIVNCYIEYFDTDLKATGNSGIFYENWLFNFDSYGFYNNGNASTAIRNNYIRTQAVADPDSNGIAVYAVGPSDFSMSGDIIGVCAVGLKTEVYSNVITGVHIEGPTSYDLQVNRFAHVVVNGGRIAEGTIDDYDTTATTIGPDLAFRGVSFGTRPIITDSGGQSLQYARLVLENCYYAEGNSDSTDGMDAAIGQVIWPEIEERLAESGVSSYTTSHASYESLGIGSTTNAFLENFHNLFYGFEYKASGKKTGTNGKYRVAMQVTGAGVFLLLPETGPDVAALEEPFTVSVVGKFVSATELNIASTAVSGVSPYSRTHTTNANYVASSSLAAGNWSLLTYGYIFDATNVDKVYLTDATLKMIRKPTPARN